MPNAWPVKYFTRDELCQPDRAKHATPEIWASLGALGVQLDKLREHIGRPIRVSGGFRDEATNRRVGGSPTSQHLLGQAADIQVDGMTPEQVARAVLACGLPFDQLIWEPTWVHVSVGPRNRRETLQVEARGAAAVGWTP